jgi:hypothetical protein
MTIEAKIIADSISDTGKRITTMQLRYPRFIHAEFMTHRVFSRNASSSRAIPVAKLIEDLRRDPAMPIYWGSNKPGMQAGNEIEDIEDAKRVWLAGRDQAIIVAESLIHGFHLHKQIANRILEPWAHINVVVTATEWDNFYELRIHPDAQPEMRELAMAMFVAQEGSIPKACEPGQWHLPYVSIDEYQLLPVGELIKLSVARCARVSYLTFEGKPPQIEEDLKLYDRLVGGRPLHASPAEHQATPLKCNGSFKSSDGSTKYVYSGGHLSGNFVGWQQYRKQLERTVFQSV